MVRLRDRLMLLCFGLIFVILSILTLSSAFEDRRFIDEKFGTWLETEAVIDDYNVTVSGPTISGRYYDYVVKYEYTISFNTDAGKVSYLRSTENTERKTSMEEADETYYTVPSGTVRTLCYDPANPDDNRWGSREEIIQDAKSPFRILMLFGVGAIGLVTIWLALKPIIKEKFQKDTLNGAATDDQDDMEVNWSDE